MATVNWSITGSTSPISATVSGTFEVTTTGNAVNSEVPTSATISSSKPGVDSFTPSEVQTYTGSGFSYVTWRNTTPGNQYPNSGLSFDIWSLALVTDINANQTWDNIISTGSFSLESTKNTVFYDYDLPDATWYGSGGTITFS